MSVSRLFYDPSLFAWNDFDRVFNELQGPVAQPHSGSSILRPRMDLHEDQDNNKITATFELPGLRKEDVHVDVHDGRLSISGETAGETEREREGYAVRERRFGKFSRSLQLPRGVKEEEIKATMDNGILKVTFPRSAPEAEPKHIKID
jgi:HSP20 family protein